jgi:uncharacterized protein
MSPGDHLASAGAIYEGTIRHRRFAPRRHEFHHRLALLYVDVDHVDELLGGRLCSPGAGLVRFRRRDYLGDPSLPLAEAVRGLVERRVGWTPGGSVRLLAHPRTCGHCFNPVSFYFCFDPQEHLGAVVAEVTNTPWGERHAYVLPREDERPVLHGEIAKRLHVSPFMGIDQRYRFRAATPGPTLSIHVESSESGRLAFDATLSLRRQALTPATLRRVVARYPLASARALALIYLHALALKLKGTPVHPRPTIPPA